MKTRTILNATLGLSLFTLGLIGGSYSAHRDFDSTEKPKIIFAADNAARGDYAGIVNDCFDRNRSNTAERMYDCIASHD